jgi:hypothetical protein
MRRHIPLSLFACMAKTAVVISCTNGIIRIATHQLPLRSATSASFRTRRFCPTAHQPVFFPALLQSCGRTSTLNFLQSILELLNLRLVRLGIELFDSILELTCFALFEQELLL